MNISKKMFDSLLFLTTTKSAAALVPPGVAGRGLLSHENHKKRPPQNISARQRKGGFSIQSIFTLANVRSDQLSKEERKLFPKPY